MISPSASASDRAHQDELPDYVSTIGHYYVEKGQRVLHFSNTLMTVQANVLKELNIAGNTPIKDLKKTLVIMNNAEQLTIPADLMLRVQKIYAEHFSQTYEGMKGEEDDQEREELLGKIVLSMKSRGCLPENETAVFGDNRREKFLWFLGNAKIERTPAIEPENVTDLSDKTILPILYCEKHDHEVPNPTQRNRAIFHALHRYLLLQRGFFIIPMTPTNSERTSPILMRSASNSPDDLDDSDYDE